MPIAILPHAICCLAICHLPSCLMPFAIEPSTLHRAPAVPCCFTLSLNSNANVTSCARWQMPHTRLEPCLGASIPTPRPHPRQSLRGGSVARAPPPGATSLHLTAERDAHRTTVNKSKMRFFSPVQAHVVESALSASVATITHLQSATMPSNGTVHQVPLKKMNKGSWSQQIASRSASTGRSQEVAGPQIIQTDTCAQVADWPTMALRDVLEQRRHEPLTPYNKGAWAEWLSSFGLQEKYPHLVQGFVRGFDLGIPTISCTYIPPNHNSVDSLNNVYSAIIKNEFAAGCYVGPFSHGQLEQVLGPFQTSPLSLVAKSLRPGKYRAVHNFSNPHKPSTEAKSINSYIDSNSFPCTWGTFTTVALIIAHLPPGSQVSVQDVAEAYRMIPAMPTQWPGLIIRLQVNDQFTVNLCNSFGLASAGGVYGMVADAGADIFWGQGMGLLAKWVDDHIFFRVPRAHLSAYNTQRAKWHCEIEAHGGHRQDGGCLWYGGKDLPNDSTEEFDEDCTMQLQDLANVSPCSAADWEFAYANININSLSDHLGIKWETSKSIPFGEEVTYLGFQWNLRSQVVYLPDEKKARYLAVIAEWREKRTHDLLETQRLYGKLLHATLVIPAGRAYLTSLEAMLASFNNSPFRLLTPPRSTPNDLNWWQHQLHRAIISIPVCRPQPLTDYKAYSDASSGFGMVITVGPRWRPWQLAARWKSQGRDIQWAEAVRFELLALCICSFSSEGEHIVLYGNNRGVIEGWWKHCSTNKPTNHVF